MFVEIVRNFSIIPQSLIYIWFLHLPLGINLNAFFYNLNESCDSISPTATVRSQTHTKLACGIMVVICWLVPLSLSWTLCFNWRLGITCLKCLFCLLVSLPVWHLIWTFFVCIYMWYSRLNACSIVCSSLYFFFFWLLLWLNTDWGRKGCTKKQRQESGEESWSRDHGGNTVYWLAHRHMPSYLFYMPRSTVLEIYNLWWSGSASLAINETPYRHAQRPSQLR